VVQEGFGHTVYDLSPAAQHDSAIAAKLIEMGWTPPADWPKQPEKPAWDEAAQRERFESHMRRYGQVDFTRDDVGFYNDRALASKWHTWKAATGGAI
jgi:hypothetical protein